MRIDGRIWVLTLWGAGAVGLLCGAGGGLTAHSELDSAHGITIDYPLQGSLFPPEITAPTVLWHDGSAAQRWTVEVTFSNHSKAVEVPSAGEAFKLGAMDLTAGPGYTPTPEQASTHTWKPDAELWARIKRQSMRSSATILIRGYAEGAEPVSQAKVTISTSSDPVGAPVFYRDVPLQTAEKVDRGPIAPLPPSAIPLIKWRVRDIDKPESRVVMENLPTCANCHSFSRDGKTLGLDMDGPRNDKGLYALAPISREMTIHSKDQIHWSSFQLNTDAKANDPVTKRFGFMSQVSPDGRYVVTSIGPPQEHGVNQDKIPGFAPGLLDRLYSTNYKDFKFLQVFYPTRGILAWYDRQAQVMKTLPGADDRNYVQTSAFWSPDGKYLIFSRALARDPYPAGAAKALYANDPNETQIQYDLYKIPFNGGRGGKAEPVQGASNNGMSNNFPKVSPDGKWIVWVQNKNGLLMRPDSKLYMVPFAGGKARLMNCNTPLMNSWHTFSPNGRWLAFSSKARGPYTQLMMTHIDENGNDSPAILVENTTAANRAVNIPEFVNVGEDGLAKINPEATQFYRYVDEAFDLAQARKLPEAIAVLRKALAEDPEDSMAHYNLGTLLRDDGQAAQALEEYSVASKLSPENAGFLESYGAALAVNGDVAGAIEALEKAAQLQPTAEFEFNLGFVLEKHGDFDKAVGPLKKAVELTGEQNSGYLVQLANAYSLLGDAAEAETSGRKALELAIHEHDARAEQAARAVLSRQEHSGPPPTP